MSIEATAPKTDAAKVKVNEEKWSKSLMDAGWTAMPSIIIEKQEALGLDALDMNIILHLSSYWWKADNLPHPSVAKIAKAVGVTERTVQKRVKSLHELGLIERQERRYTQHGSRPNLYSFKGLIEKAKPFAEEKLADIAEHKAKNEARLKRKKPRLTVVQGDKE